MSPPPPSLWVTVTSNIWSRSFYIAPLMLPVLVLLTLLSARPQEVNVKVFVLVWFVAVPVGFLLWVVSWLNYGGSGGRISSGVAVTAVLGWCIWHRGLFLAWIEKRTARGYYICAGSLFSMAAVRQSSDVGTAPIFLAMIAAVVGLAIPFTIGIVARLHIATRLFLATVGVPVWKFLSQPIRLTGKEQNTGQTSCSIDITHLP